MMLLNWWACTVSLPPDVADEPANRIEAGTWSRFDDPRLSNNIQALYQLGVESDGTVELHRAHFSEFAVDRLDRDRGTFVVASSDVGGDLERPRVGRMVTDADGRLCSERNQEFDGSWWFTVTCGDVWVDLVQEGESSSQQRPSFAMDADGGMHFAWWDVPADELRYQGPDGMESLDLGTGWVVQETELGVGPDGAVSLLAVTNDTSGSPSYRAYEDVRLLTRDPSGTWTDTRLSRSDITGKVHTFSNRGQSLAVSPDGQVAAAYRVWVGDRIATTIWVDGLSTLVEPDTTKFRHTVAVAWVNDVLHGVWAKSWGPSGGPGSLVLGVHGDAGWETEVIPGSSALRVDLAADGDGRPVVATYDLNYGAKVFTRSDPMVAGVPAVRTVGDLEPGDLVVTEVQANPADADDAVGEWIEVYNPGSSAIDLDGLVVQDGDGHTGGIRGSAIVAAGGYAVVGKSDAARFQPTTLAPLAFWGNQPALNNDGDEVQLHGPNGLLGATPPYGSARSGMALALDPDGLADDPDAWCDAAPTPGEPNDPC